MIASGEVNECKNNDIKSIEFDDEQASNSTEYERDTCQKNLRTEKMEEKEEPEELNSGNQDDDNEKGNCDNDDSDDFGDFEQAHQPESTEGSPHFQDPCSSKTLRVHEQWDQFYDLPIGTLLEEALNFYKDDPNNFCRIDVNTETPNLISLLNAENHDKLEGLTLRANQLWSQIFCIEEMQALQFRWEDSHSYELFCKALALNNGYTIVGGQLVKGNETNLSTGEQPSPTRKCPKDANSAVVDSLMVPPADFDWRSSGLANPLNATFKIKSSSPAPPPFDCSSFLVDHQQQMMNSSSILERDLQAFGLVLPNSTSN